MSTTSAPLVPGRTALLVMDYQAGIVGTLPDADALVARTARAVATARSAGAHVGYVRVAFAADDYGRIPATNKAFTALAGSGRVMHPDAPETAVYEALAPQEGDIAVRKVRIGAMSTTDLDARLRARGIDTLVLAGVSTSGVVLSTVTDAADRDYRVIVLADGCADRDPEVHRVLTGKVFPSRADVVDVADLAGLFGAE